MRGNIRSADNCAHVGWVGSLEYVFYRIAIGGRDGEARRRQRNYDRFRPSIECNIAYPRRFLFVNNHVLLHGRCGGFFAISVISRGFSHRGRNRGRRKRPSGKLIIDIHRIGRLKYLLRRLSRRRSMMVKQLRARLEIQNVSCEKPRRLRRYAWRMPYFRPIKPYPAVIGCAHLPAGSHYSNDGCDVFAQSATCAAAKGQFGHIPFL